MKLRIMIVDDHELFRKGLIQLLKRVPWADVCAEAGNLDEALRLIPSVKPHLLLLDLYLGNDEKTFKTVPVIRRITPDLKIIILTVSEDEEDIYEAAEYEVDGYILKNTPFQKFCSYLLDIWKGNICISETLASRLFTQVMNKTKTTPLTQREQEILTLVTDGLTNKEIAAKLYISEFTVKNHVSNIMKKMNVASRNQLIINQLRKKHSVSEGHHTLRDQ